jgi:hypothetical protein
MNEQLQSVLGDYDKLVSFLHDAIDDSDVQRYLSFSDNLVVGAPVVDGYEDGALFSFI